MHRHRVLCPLALGLLVQLTIAATAGAQGVSQPRTLWVYEGGWFEQVSPKKWVEMNRDLFRDGSDPISFTEVGRSSLYVDLYDATRTMFIRLSDGRMEWRQNASSSWNLLYLGRWKN